MGGTRKEQKQCASARPMPPIIVIIWIGGGHKRLWILQSKPLKTREQNHNLIQIFCLYTQAFPLVISATRHLIEDRFEFHDPKGMGDDRECHRLRCCSLNSGQPAISRPVYSGVYRAGSLSLPLRKSGELSTSLNPTNGKLGLAEGSGHPGRRRLVLAVRIDVTDQGPNPGPLV